MKTSRRTFLGASLALPTLWETKPTAVAEARTAETSASKDSSFDPWVEIHRENLRHNVQEISRRVASRPILAVIKNNGYGAGVANIARLLERQNEIAGFAVVKFHEAMTLRDAGIRKPILLLGPFDERNLLDAAARNIMPMVYTPQADALDKVAAKLQKPVPLHICIDTGIGRVGVPYYQAAPLIRDLAARRSVEIRGTMMTFTEDAELDKEQIRRFQETCGTLEKEGIALGRKHAASSFALFQHPDAFFDMVRPGMAIYGIYSENELRRTGVMDLRPALSLKARVIYVKKLRKGDSAGYNRAYIAKDEVWAATLPVGHADGWPRAAAKGAKVRINGDFYPVIASVSASHCILEIGGEEGIKIGDTATFFDSQQGSRPEDVSEAWRLGLRPDRAPESTAASANRVTQTLYLSLGSNLGHRAKNLRDAVASLREAGLEVTKVSSVYETEPVDYLDQPWFLNLAVEAKTELSAADLLHALREIEMQMGSKRRIAKGPRLIDMDILLFGDAVIDTPELQVPHPRMHLRRFVLEPLAEVAPNALHPVLSLRASEMLERTMDKSVVRKFHASRCSGTL